MTSTSFGPRGLVELFVDGETGVARVQINWFAIGPCSLVDARAFATDLAAAINSVDPNARTNSAVFSHAEMRPLLDLVKERLEGLTGTSPPEGVEDPGWERAVSVHQRLQAKLVALLPKGG